MRFLCDEMLQGLGGWLRAAGYDTLIEDSGATDRQLLEQARREGRLLLTRDRKLLEHRGAEATVVLLEGNSLEACAIELAQRLSLNWLHQPFSRCVRCNTPLRDAPPRHRLRLPLSLRLRHASIRYCPRCEQAYWAGSHVRHMQHKLSGWARAARRAGAQTGITILAGTDNGTGHGTDRQDRAESGPEPCPTHGGTRDGVRETTS